MNISDSHTDDTILVEIGERLKRYRLVQQLTQAELAGQAGIGKRTLERVEAGETAQFSTIIRILRVLGLLEKLDQVLTPHAMRPLEAAARKGKVRQRASRKGKSKQGKPWTWDESE